MEPQCTARQAMVTKTLGMELWMDGAIQAMHMLLFIVLHFFVVVVVVVVASG
jgi:hypothetical protein